MRGVGLEAALLVCLAPRPDTNCLRGYKGLLYVREVAPQEKTYHGVERGGGGVNMPRSRKGEKGEGGGDNMSWGRKGEEEGAGGGEVPISSSTGTKTKVR